MKPWVARPKRRPGHPPVTPSPRGEFMPDTEILPALDESDATTRLLPIAGTYTLRRDRCVIEPSIRLLRYPLLRGRFTASGGHVEFTTDEDGHRITVVLDAASLRTGVPGLRRMLLGSRALDAEQYPDITFTSSDIHLGADRAIDSHGRLDLTGTSRDLRLLGRLHYVDDQRIVLWAKGTLPPPRRKPRNLNRIARLLVGCRITVEIAVEFVR
jgi:polyisoprenoid-binding protein YceI